ncbi:post-transcriptional regulator [Virgibacillus siamensis]|uniref:post-transcriptional regulator n=1 Tax=Virgibacillus siamensis TaxID=480071 RepID=UPI000984E127|nr:post-transcriptional regulator [Virgibacillus siamensis]
METVKCVRDWRNEIEMALECKKDEFRMMGYRQASNDDIWKCLEEKVWKGNPQKRLYEVVQDIFHLASNIYMSYLTVNAYQDEDLMASIAAVVNGHADAEK